MYHGFYGDICESNYVYHYPDNHASRPYQGWLTIRQKIENGKLISESDYARYEYALGEPAETDTYLLFTSQSKKASPSGNMKEIKRFTLYNDETQHPVRDLVPCYREIDGLFGFYDLCGSICPLTGTPLYINANTNINNRLWVRPSIDYVYGGISCYKDSAYNGNGNGVIGDTGYGPWFIALVHPNKYMSVYIRYSNNYTNANDVMREYDVEPQSDTVSINNYDIVNGDESVTRRYNLVAGHWYAIPIYIGYSSYFEVVDADTGEYLLKGDNV